MPAPKLRTAIIGTGMIANAGHIPAWKNLKDHIDLVAVADLNPERANLVARTEGIPRAYGDWRQMLAQVQPDLVSVCTPNCYHKTHTLAALEAGAHVLCEKPVATSYADAVEMFDAAAAAHRVLFVCQSLRFYESAIAAKELVDAGRLGQVYYAELTGMRRRGIPTWGQFHMREHSGGGPVYDLGVHQFDGLFWLLGNPRVRAVSASTYTKFGNRDEGLKTSLAESGAPLGVLTPRPYDYREFDVEDMAAGFLRLEGEVVVSFKTSWAAHVTKETFNTTLLGTAGGLTLDPLALTTNLGSYQVEVAPKPPPDRAVHFSGHWRLTEHLVRVIRGEAAPLVQRAEVLNVMRALDAIYESARVNREIWLE
ncbi:MAG: Gfo/Idh/MocA family oxidoreductase [Verrucomicrobia bacterium]|nr:Gfo/Idh/MocA family oxidoreductase [Verrucomicrobiota bacterium]